MLFPAWISNRVLNKVWDEITYSFSNVNGDTPHFIMGVITYPYKGYSDISMA